MGRLTQGEAACHIVYTDYPLVDWELREAYQSHIPEESHYGDEIGPNYI